MSFLDLNGLAVDVDVDGFDRDYTDIQSFGRSEGLTFEGAFFAQKREWKFSVPWTPAEHAAISVRDWIKGRGHYWQFQRVDGTTIRFNKFSSEGGPGFNTNITNGTARFTAVSPSCPLWGALVTFGLTSTVTVAFGSDGRYSISLWKNDWGVPTGASWKLCSVTFDGATQRFFAPGSLVTTSFSSWLTISAVSGALSVSLLGKNTAGASSNAFYDKLWIVPYSLSTTMINAREARTITAQFEPAFPYVEMDGDCLEDVFPIAIKGFVESEEMTQVMTSTPAISNARCLKVHLIEK